MTDWDREEDTARKVAKLRDELIEALVVEVPIDGGGALTTTPLDEEALRYVWIPVARASVVEVLRELLASVGAQDTDTVQYVPEYIERVVAARVTATEYAARVGLEGATRHAVGACVTRFFQDPVRFAEPVLLECNERTYEVRRDGDAIVVTAVSRGD